MIKMDMNWQKVLKMYLKDEELRSKSKRRKSVATGVEQFFRKFSNKDLNEIVVDDIRKWFVILSNKDYSPDTLRCKLVYLKVFFDFAIEEDWLSENPVSKISLPRIPQTPPKCLSLCEVNALRELAKNDHPSHLAIIETLYATGVRIGELVNIKLDDINWHDKMIKVLGKDSIERIVPFSSDCDAVLNHYLSHKEKVNSPYLFTNRYYHTNTKMHTETVRKILSPYAKKLGLPLTAHALRHTFAAHLAAKGMRNEEIQFLLGHVNSEYTKLYSRLFDNTKKNLYDKYF
jgi:integrase/recombinase XerC